MTLIRKFRKNVHKIVGSVDIGTRNSQLDFGTDPSDPDPKPGL